MKAQPHPLSSRPKWRDRQFSGPLLEMFVGAIKKEASCLASFPFPLSLVLQGKVVAIQGHHLVPCRDEVLHKRLLRVARCIDLRNGTELGV